MTLQKLLSAPALALLCAAAFAAPEAPAPVNLVGRAVPEIDKLPPGQYRELVQYGHELTVRTFAHIGPEVQDVRRRLAGNNLACASCHQQNATKPFAMPWSGVSATFPQYRGREDDISTVEERVNGCMERSMNGKPLPLGSDEMKAFVAYIHFLSQGIPVGQEVEGAATKATRVPDRRADLVAGRQVYQAQCVACHGPDGQGVRAGAAGSAQGYVFPPLWGKDSFNNGAGMNRLLTATRFIRHNMPQGTTFKAPVLTDDEAFDVAAYVLSQPRPVKAGLDKDFPARWNKPVDAAFPPYVDGAPADQHRFGPYPPLLEAAKKRQPN